MPKDDPMMAQPDSKPSPPAESTLADVERSETEVSVGSAGVSDSRIIAPPDPEVVARASRRRTSRKRWQGAGVLGRPFQKAKNESYVSYAYTPLDTIVRRS